MTLFACIISFMLGWLAHKTADMYDRKREKDLEYAFLSGLKAGRPKWHDLRKDQKNLPERKETE